MDNKKLIEMADKAKEYAYVPFSHFNVGAAVLTAEGKVYTGCNIENSSLGATNCAERTAIFKAISEGYKNFTKIAVMSSSGDFTSPCGICRQVIFEFFDEECEILLGNNKGEIKVYKVKEILPIGFKVDSF
ncbi:MAG: cytidine deaminase [Lachnospirales bacterium]